MNEAWHRKHRLARGASLGERLKWHVAHQKACACRELPASIRAELGQRGAAPSKPKSKSNATNAGKTPAKATARPNATHTPPLDPHFAAVVHALRDERGVSFGGKGFGSSALKLDDKIFAMWTSKDAFVVKLARERVAELVEQGRGRYFDPGRGRLMREWLEVTTAKRMWLSLAKEALEFGRGR
jgi:hypothetical protein